MIVAAWCGVVVCLWWWYDVGLRISIWIPRNLLSRNDVNYKLPPGHLGLPLVGETPFILLSNPSNKDKMGTYLLKKHYKYGKKGFV